MVSIGEEENAPPEVIDERTFGGPGAAAAPVAALDDAPHAAGEEHDARRSATAQASPPSTLPVARAGIAESFASRYVAKADGSGPLWDTTISRAFARHCYHFRLGGPPPPPPPPPRHSSTFSDDPAWHWPDQP